MYAQFLKIWYVTFLTNLRQKPIPNGLRGDYMCWLRAAIGWFRGFFAILTKEIIFIYLKRPEIILGVNWS